MTEKVQNIDFIIGNVKNVEERDVGWCLMLDTGFTFVTGSWKPECVPGDEVQITIRRIVR